MALAMHQKARCFMMGDSAFKTYTTKQIYMHKSDEQRVRILEQKKDLDSWNISDSVNAVQDIQAHLIRIDHNRQHHEILAPAFTTRFLDNLDENRKD